MKKTKPRRMNKRASMADVMMGVLLAVVTGFVLLTVVPWIRENARSGSDIKTCDNMPGTYCYAEKDCETYGDQYLPSVKGCGESKPYCCLSFTAEGPEEDDTVEFYIFTSTGQSFKINDGATIEVPAGKIGFSAEIFEPDELTGNCKIYGDMFTSPPLDYTDCSEGNPNSITDISISKDQTYTVHLEAKKNEGEPLAITATIKGK